MMSKTRLLLIDNYDSFTYNLVQFFGELGCEITVWRNDQFTLDDVHELAAEAIVISPGPCTPTEAGNSVEVVSEFGAKTPILGICLGHQSIGQAFGATVALAKQPVHGKTSKIRHTGQDLFAGMTKEIEVTRYHSLLVRDLPSELVATAWHTDPEEEVLMAMQHREYPIYGMQYHPESIATTNGMEMLHNFLRLAQRFQQKGDQ